MTLDAEFLTLIAQQTADHAINSFLDSLFQRDPSGHYRLPSGTNLVSEHVIREMARKAVEQAMYGAETQIANGGLGHRNEAEK